MPICFRLFAHLIRRAASRAAWTAGSSSAMSTPMIAMTTSTSISVNPRRRIRPSFPERGLSEGSRVPDLHGPILAPRGEAGAVAVERDGEDTAAVPAEGGEFL